MPIKTRMYPRTDAFKWKDAALENGSWDENALSIYKHVPTGCFKAEFDKEFHKGTETFVKRVCRTISEAEFEFAKGLLYTLYVRANNDKDCAYYAKRINWFVASIA